MPSLKRFREQLEQYGYTLRESSVDDNLAGFLTGGRLGEVDAILRVSEKVCNVGVLLGLYESVPERRRYSLLVALLELNFEHPFAHASLFRVPDSENKDEFETAILVAESSFFWTEMTQEKFDTRIESLIALAEAASKELASRDAISMTNAFYERLKSRRSPVQRETFAASRES